jgi:hypothetical protein
LVAGGCKIVTSTPKNPHARVIDLDKRTIHQLRVPRRRQEVVRAEWCTNYQTGDLVVCEAGGSPFHPHTFSKPFERIISRMDLPTTRLHDLGRTSVTSTMQVYQHALPGMRADAAATFGKISVGGNRE